MGILRDLLCAASTDPPSPTPAPKPASNPAPKPAPKPSLDISELKHAKFAQLLEKTMASSSEVMHSEPLKEQVSGYMTSCLKAKSHSVSNTKRTIQQIFDTAIETRDSDKDKDVLRWVQFCVETCLSQQQGSEAKSVEISAKAPLEKKPSPEKEALDDDSDGEAQVASVGYHQIGASDDDYLPSDDDDHTVPTMKTHSKKKKKEKDEEEDQQVPDDDKKKKTTRKKEADQPPFIQPNAGSKAVASYFTTTHPMSILQDSGYFAKSYFFPSKESFNAFISVLNSAQKTIDVCIFSFTDDDVADALIAAKKRNVEIRIITDNQQAAGVGADAERLQKDYGIPYKTDHTTGYFHHKFAVVDSKTLINGSFNWSKGARFKNRENIIITNFPYCIKEFKVQFEALWEEF